MSKELKDRQNVINELFQEKDLELQKLAKEQGYSPAEVVQLRQRMRDTMNSAKDKATNEMGDSLDSLNAGKTIKVAQSADIGSMAKRAALKKVGSKLLRSVPVLGGLASVAMGLNSGDASAAIPGLDEAEDVGQSAADEKQMLAEHDARVNYDKSPAKLDRLKAMMGGRAPASEQSRPVPTELSLDQPPAASARDIEPQAAEIIAPAMQDQIRNKLQQAEELKPQDVRASRLRKLFNTKS